MFIRELKFKTVDLNIKEKNISEKEEVLLLDSPKKITASQTNESIANFIHGSTCILLEFESEEIADEFRLESEMLFKVWCVKSFRGNNMVSILKRNLPVLNDLVSYYKPNVIE